MMILSRVFLSLNLLMSSVSLSLVASCPLHLLRRDFTRCAHFYGFLEIQGFFYSVNIMRCSLFALFSVFSVCLFSYIQKNLRSHLTIFLAMVTSHLLIIAYASLKLTWQKAKLWFLEGKTLFWNLTWLCSEKNGLWRDWNANQFCI